MRAASSPGEQEQIRLEHHDRMKEIARKQGLTIPDEPPASGQGIGPGGEMGPGRGMVPRGGRLC